MVRLALVSLVLTAAWALLDGLGRPVDGPPDRVAAQSVSAIVLDTGTVAQRALPRNFVAVEGYRPRVVDGMLLDPAGGCSSPVPLPAEFTPVCRRHDLGYDLLRLAARDGGALPATARRAVDAQLAVGMHDACRVRSGLSRASCDGWASVATAAVRVNSVRQHWSVPDRETPLSVSTAAAGVGAALSGLVALLVAIRLATASLLRSVRRGAGAAAGTREVLS